MCSGNINTRNCVAQKAWLTTTQSGCYTGWRRKDPVANAAFTPRAAHLRCQIRYIQRLLEYPYAAIYVCSRDERGQVAILQVTIKAYNKGTTLGLLVITWIHKLHFLSQLYTTQWPNDCACTLKSSITFFLQVTKNMLTVSASLWMA